MLPGGDSYRRSVAIDYLYHNDDGTLQRVVQTTEGVSVPPEDHASSKQVQQDGEAPTDSASP